MHAIARILVVIALLLWGLLPAQAHDVPAEMQVHAFAKTETGRLHLLVRIPLGLLLNIDLPKQGPGYLDLARIGPGLERALSAVEKEISLYEEESRLAPLRAVGRISLPSDKSFEDFESARVLLSGPPLPPGTYVFWNQGYLDAWLEYSIHSAQSGFQIDFNIVPGMRERLKIDLRYLSEDGVVRAYQLPGGAGPLALDPRWHQAAWTFVKSGFSHILDGTDHLLFLLCLILPFRKAGWKLVGVVTAFTAGHTITLIAAAYQLAPSGNWFPPLVELLIAASIIWMAVENMLHPRLERRWLVAGLFGLVHGFGFSFMLQEQLQFAGSHLFLSLLAFNLGVEMGQLLVLALALPLLALLYRSKHSMAQLVPALVCVLVGHTAWHWMEERAAALGQADWPGISSLAPGWPVLLGAALLMLGGLGWLRRKSVARQAGGADASPSVAQQETS